MSTPTLRERLADILSQVYDDRPVVEPEPTEAAPHYRAAGAVLAVLPLYETAASARPDDALSRIAEAMNALAAPDGGDALELKLRLTAILDGPPLPIDLSETESPRPLTADRIRTRLEERLIANWPRMNHAGHAHDIADSLMNDVLLIVTELQDQASGWRGQVDRTLEARDQARVLAAALEEITAEATRLLRDGEYGRALATLQVAALDLDPHLADARDDAEREAVGAEYDPDYGRDLGDEE